MQLALRGVAGLGFDEGVFDPEMEGIDWEWEYVSDPGSTTTLITGGGYVGAPITLPSGGYVGVTPASGSPFIDPAKLIQALTAGTIQVSRIVAGTASTPVCPSGYQLPNGQCVTTQQQAGVSGGSQWISGISNNTLMIAGIGFVGLMLLSGGSGGGRRR